MPAVTALIRAKPGKNRSQVGHGRAARIDLEIDGERFASCTENIIAEFRLYVGRELSPKTIDELSDRIVETDALSVCHVAVASRQLTEHQLREKLVARKFDESVIERTLARCHELRLLNDAQYAETFVASRRRRGLGDRRIWTDLHQRGVAKEHIDAALGSGDGGISSTTRAAEFLQKKFAGRDLSDPAFRGKAMRQLQSRGFSGEEVYAALRLHAEAQADSQ